MIADIVLGRISERLGLSDPYHFQLHDPTTVDYQTIEQEARNQIRQKEAYERALQRIANGSENPEEIAQDVL